MSVFDINNLTEEQQDEAEKPLVMLVDDEIENINVLRQLLESKFRIISGLNGKEALKLIDNMDDPEQIQLIISDQRMPEITGVEFLEQIVERMPDTIRIILTGYSDTQVIIDSINKAKLYKFMTKPFDPVELSLTVQRGVEAFQMRQQLVEYTLKLEEIVIKRTAELNHKNEELTAALANLELLSLTDQLTGVHNRHFLSELLPKELAKMKRDMANEPKRQKMLGLIMLDIDLFKQVNDRFGHDAGDKVLIRFALVLEETCRESDWVVRWGGEEFVIVTRGLSIEGLQHLAERVRKNVELETFDLGCNNTTSITCSLGLTSIPFIAKHHDALTWEQTLNLADLALYIAKRNGRNTWVSLFENNIKQFDHFYEDAMTNLKALIENGGISYNSPLSKESVNL